VALNPEDMRNSPASASDLLGFSTAGYMVWRLAALISINQACF
jgi:hypothetical protein